MKFIILGFPEYLSNLIFHLKDSEFLNENKIDIIFVESIKPNYSFKKIKRLLKTFTVSKFLYKIIYRMNKTKYDLIINHIFPKKDILFLKNYNNINLIKYTSLNEIKNLESYDLMIVATFGQKIPSSIFSKPKKGTLNIHPSYLPKQRGGYPTYVQSFKSEKYSGTTIHCMGEKWDNGDIVIQDEYEVSYDMSNHTRFLLSAKYAAILLNRLNDNKFNFNKISQNENQISYCHKIIKPIQKIENINQIYHLKGIVQANFASHLFPFTYIFYRFRLICVLDIEEVFNEFKFPLIKNKVNIFRKNGNFYLNFYGKLYILKKYLFGSTLIVK